MVELDLPSPDRVSIEIIDALGQVLFTEKSEHEISYLKKQYDLGNMTKQIYLIKIEYIVEYAY